MTLREIHERCKARHFVDESSVAHHPERPWCGFCFHSWPCDDYADAVAAIRALDEAPAVLAGSEEQMRVITDPAPPTENT